MRYLSTPKKTKFIVVLMFVPEVILQPASDTEVPAVVPIVPHDSDLVQGVCRRPRSRDRKRRPKRVNRR